MANLNNPAVKRIMGEIKELAQSPPEEFRAEPLEDNLFEWHFSVRGPRGTSFEGGTYHGKIILPSEYPFKPPTITLLTPNGRFEVGKKICLSVSAHHPEHWQPAWGIRTIITALIAFMPSKADGALAGLDYTDEERRTLATRSNGWRCASCGVKMCEVLPPIAARAAGDAAPPTPSPSVPSELRFGYEPSPTGASSQPSAGSSSGASAQPVPPAQPAQPAQSTASASAAAAQPADVPAQAWTAPASASTPSSTAPAQPAPPTQRLTPPQPTPRQEPPAGSKLVWVLVVAIFALVVRKMLKSGCADEENALDDALCTA